MTEQKEIEIGTDAVPDQQAAASGTKQARPAGVYLGELQRQQRLAVEARKRKAFRIAGGFAIALHVIGILAGAVYFIQKTVLEKHGDGVESVVLEASKPQPKRRTPPRTRRAPKQPKLSQVRAPKGQPITTSANIPIGNARFTLPTSDVSATRPVMAPSAAGLGKNMFTAQQASITTTMPKFEVPKFETTSLATSMDMGSNLAQTEFNDMGNLELASVNLGDAKQTFNAFLKAVRERIKQAQRFPPQVRSLDASASATVRFTLFRDGTVQNLAITDSSGSKALDTAAMAAVQNAVPYPPFPEEQAGNSLRLELPIVFELSN